MDGLGGISERRSILAARRWPYVAPFPRAPPVLPFHILIYRLHCRLRTYNISRARG